MIQTQTHEHSDARTMQVRARILKDRRFDNWASAVEGRWTIEDLRADAGYSNDWISFDSLAWDSHREQLFVGLASINTDIFHVYDPRTSSFRSLGFQRVSDRFDAKFHRSLEIDDDGTIYAATALLHDVDQQRQAKGGKLVRYDPDRDLYKVLAIPAPPHYIQSITLDRERRLIYGFTYPGEYLFQYDLETNECKTLAYVGNGILMCQPHCAVLDRQGRLWGTWGESRAFEEVPGPVPVRLFCYDPDKDEFTWFKHGLAKTEPGDPARVDHMLLANDGLIYVGTVAGGLSRLDPTTGEVQDLGKPFGNPRLSGLVQAPDGLIYGAGNAGYAEDGSGTVRMFSFDPKSATFEQLGPIMDEERGASAAKVHILVAAPDGTLYAGENDNTFRSSYLWQCKVT